MHTVDPNCSAVLHFAINELDIHKIILCGHYGCSGVRAAMTESASGISEHWLGGVHETMERHRAELTALDSEKARLDRLCELNVKQQVYNLAASPIVQRAWAAGTEVVIHGVIYGLHDGLLRELGISLEGPPD